VERFLLWRGLDGWRTEAAHVELTGDRVRASGTQLGVEPLLYRLDYELETFERFVTASLLVRASGEGWARSLELRHDGEGAWSCELKAEGEIELPPAGGEMDALAGALDCDLAFSPLTNLMPIRRSELHRRAGSEDFVMAWVSVPDLKLHASPQRYEHVCPGVVRFVSLDGDFTAELELDDDGLVARYPRLAERVAARPAQS
jgi:uncharacterized protein